MIYVHSRTIDSSVQFWPYSALLVSSAVHLTQICIPAPLGDIRPDIRAAIHQRAVGPRRSNFGTWGSKRDSSGVLDRTRRVGPPLSIPSRYISINHIQLLPSHPPILPFPLSPAVCTALHRHPNWPALSTDNPSAIPSGSPPRPGPVHLYPQCPFHPHPEPHRRPAVVASPPARRTMRGRALLWGSGESGVVFVLRWRACHCRIGVESFCDADALAALWRR
ncbi:hypothetical protein EDC01DRAFT_745087 [Geopyxis carbonaria]|nr:hypothetical protein EDC01DRAFT_745087 [Geopyxis carbonaria]